MAQEIKNTFLKAKMNKDLDDRIIPNGEYRDALNVGVGRSESDNVGSVENIIGNSLISQTDLGSIEIIGNLVDSTNDRVFIFLTDYTDPSPENPTDAPFGTQHYIYVFNTKTGSYNRLVQGEFLNFSTTNRIIGVNLIEQLLFWTDNRNQPRKINIELATATVQSSKEVVNSSDTDYYTEEHQISVAKYSPYQPINLVNKLRVVNTGTATSYIRVEGNRVEELTPFIGGIIVSPEDNVSGEDYCTITTVVNVGSETRINIEPNLPGGNSATPGAYYNLFKSTMTNKKNDPSWPGDPDYLEDKFVRFSYRFKYDDNEYSLIAPFTQIAYVPKQKGYFVNGQEEAAYRSTVLDWFENDVQNIELNVPLPCPGNRLKSHYKISEMEILFRESDTVAIKVLESVSAGEVSAFSRGDNVYTYDYQSRKPYRTLAEAQTVRVYDKVPVRAQSQEVSGNRVIYGNYRDQHTPPTALNYNCRINRKLETGKYNNFVEYPNHTVKRNRNYQVGFVLSDKFGRTSPVILSNVDLGATEGGKFYSGSTIYSPYDSGPDDTPDILEWFGDTIQVLVNEAISSTKNLSEGTPGLYAIENKRDTSGEGYAVLPDGILINGNVYQFRWDPTYTNNKNLPDENDYLRGQFEDFVEVESIEEIDPALNLYQVITDGQVNESYLREENLPSNSPDLKFSYRLNDLGWYSYKIVVKQTQQEYYNAYLPGILNGYPGQAYKWTELSKLQDYDPSLPNYETIIGDFKLTLSGYKFPNELDVTAHTALFNDNINKIPRDLSEVGPDQKQYRSSVVLYGRVTNIMEPAYGPTFGPARSSDEFDREHLSKPQNTQYYPRTNSGGVNAVKHVATQVGNSRDMQMGLDDLSPSALKLPIVGLYGEDSGGEGGQDVFYSLDSNPLIAKISTEDKSIGWPNIRPAGGLAWDPDSGEEEPIQFSYPQNMLPALAIYETEPVESNLDIYWETTSAGLIVDLNADINGFAGAALAVEGFSWDFTEDMTSGMAVSTPFRPIDSEGNPYVIPATMTLEEVTSPGGNQGVFELEETGVPGFYQIILAQNVVEFKKESRINDVYTFTINVETAEGFTSQIVLGGQEGGDGALANVSPSFDYFLPTNQGNVYQRNLSGDESVIIGANEWQGVTNGAFGTQGNPSVTDIVYEFKMLDGTTPPETWSMNSSTGELTCQAGETDNGIYQIELIIKDASPSPYNPVPTGDYGVKSFSQDADIIVGYAAVNPGCLTSPYLCVLDPMENPSPVPSFDRALTLGATNSGGVLDVKDAIWYVGRVLDHDDNNHFSQFLFYDQNGSPFTPSRSNTAGDPNLWTSATNGGNAYIYNLGPEPGDILASTGHKRGTIVFSINIKIKENFAFQALRPTFKIFWRVPGDDASWTEMEYPGQTSVEYNQNNWPPGEFGDISGYAKDDFPSIGDTYPNYVYVQYIRAFDRLDFPEQLEGDIEYAIVAKGFEYEGGETGEGIIWVQSDDLHYPKCVPIVIQGTGTDDIVVNAAQKVYSDPYDYADNALFNDYYEYDRSAGTDSYIRDTNNTGVLYAETPYLEYVHTFYEDVELNTVWKPLSSEQGINFGWKGNYLGQFGEWMEWGSVNKVILRCSAQFSYQTGEKIAGVYNNALYVSARQTTSYPSESSTDPEPLFGITRFRFDN